MYIGIDVAAIRSCPYAVLGENLHLVDSGWLRVDALDDALGQLLERQGELEMAMACFRNALRMTQGRAPEPLPLEPARLRAPDGDSVSGV